jgi:hypothetical protein
MTTKAITLRDTKRGSTVPRIAKLSHCGGWWPDEDGEDWDDEWLEPIEMGSAEPASGADHGASSPVLWVPDPESRHMWREFYCNEPLPERAPIGFSY